MSKILSYLTTHSPVESNYLNVFNFFNTIIFNHLKRFSIVLNKTNRIKMLYEDFFFIVPEEKDALYAENPYISLFVPLKIEINKNNKKEILKTNFFIGNFPFITDTNSIVLDNIDKQIVPQLVFDPILSFNFVLGKEKDKYTANIFKDFLKNIIITCEKSKKSFGKKVFNLQIGPYNNIPLNLFLKSFDLSESLLCKVLPEHIDEIKSVFSKSNFNNTIDNSLLINKLLSFIDKNFIDEHNLSSSPIFNLFNFNFDIKTRIKLNEKLKINVPLSCCFLTKIDLIFILKNFFDLIKHKREIDDIDALFNKTVNDLSTSLNFIIKNIVEKNLVKLLVNSEYFCDELLKKNIYTKTDEFDIETVEGQNSGVDIAEDSIKEKKRGKKNIKKFLKESNNELSIQIDEFLSSSELSLTQEETNPLAILSQQKKILTLNKQEGNENLPEEIRNIHTSGYGKLCVIETPEGQSAGLINNVTFLALIDEMGFLETPLLEEKPSSLFFVPSDIDQYVNILFDDVYAIDKGVLEAYSKKNSGINSFSIATTPGQYKPFSPYQFFSIACNTIPFLEHNDGNRILMGANMQRQALCLIKPQIPIVNTGCEFSLIYSFPFVFSFSSGEVESANYETLVIKTKKGNSLVYFLNNLYNSSNENIVYEKSIVWPGEEVKFGQILVEGFGSKNGNLSLGTNLTVAYMSWEGLNFEDSIIINEELVLSDRFTFLQMKTISVDLDMEEEFLEFNLIKDKKLFSKLSNLNSFGVVQKNTFVKKGDVLLMTRNKMTDDFTTIESEFEGFVYDIKINPSVVYSNHDIIKNDLGLSETNITFYILHKNKIQTGDKLAGRYGNKGVISKIIPSADMPSLLDGTKIDIILNPLGIPSRMNLGQLFEGLLGLSGRINNERFFVSSFDEVFEKEASKILVENKIQIAAKKNKKQIMLNKNLFFKNLLLDGRTGNVFDNPIFVTSSYILRLFHLVEEKITSRTLGPKGLVTEQPLKGKSQEGGQRFGEMEVWAIEAYGAAFNIQDILILKSDDILLTDKLEEIMEEGTFIDSVSLSKTNLLLQYELRALGLDLDEVKLELKDSMINRKNFINSNFKKLIL